VSTWRRLGTHPPLPPTDDGVAAVAVAAADGFADPPGLTVRGDVLAAVGGPEPVRAGALADLVARLEAAGHAVATKPEAAPRRRAGLAALHREGSARFWLWRRYPQRFPLPTPGDTPPLRLAVMALGALRANGLPPARR
jgi:hypothetical protein